MNNTIIVRLATLILVGGILMSPTARGQMFVANFGYNSIDEIEANGNATTFVSGGLLDGPSAMAFDSSGNLYVANFGNNTIEEFSGRRTGIGFVIGGLNEHIAIAFSPVPEPSTWLLLVTGVGAFFSVRSGNNWRKILPRFHF